VLVSTTSDTMRYCDKFNRQAEQTPA